MNIVPNAPHSRLSALQIAAAVRAGDLSAQTVTEAALQQIAAHDDELNAFTAVLAERAMAQAARVDSQVKAGRDPGPLAGCPFAVKNLFDVEGLTTLAGSKIRASAAPATRDAAGVSRLAGAGGVLVGALNMDEFAYGFSTENAHYGVTANPHARGRLAGGSSGGSAAAVAAGLVPLSLGSDTNGSIRVPAALCGIFGLKPTFGRLSRSGAFPFASSFDHIGPLARTVDDLALAYDALQGADPSDPACAQRAIDPVSATLDRSPGQLRVGLLEGWFRKGAMAEVLAATDAVAAAFRDCKRVEMAEAERARSAAFCITAAEGAALHLPELRVRAQDYDPATRDRLLAGALIPAAVIVQAQRFRRWFQQSVAELFHQFDLLIAPTTLCTAPQIGQALMDLGGTAGPVRANLGLYTQPLSFIGLPVLAAPVAGGGELPLSVQLIAAPWREELIFQVAHWLEQEGVLLAPTPRRKS